MSKLISIRRATILASILAGVAAAATTPLAVNTAFATTGVTALSTPVNYEAFVGAMAQADGKVVAAGNFGTSQGSDLVLARFRADGTLDAGFGLGGIALHDAGSISDSLRAMALLPDGRIVVVGQSGGRALIARFGADGGADASFGTGGFFKTGVVGAANARLATLSVLPDGALLGVGSVMLADGEHVLMVKVDPNGALDRSFDQDGVRVVREALGSDPRSQRLADGRIVVAARAPGWLRVMRFAADGSLDPSFGSGGIASFPTTAVTPTTALATLPEGYLVAERADARLTLVDSNGTLRSAQALAPGAELAALVRSPDGRVVLALDTLAQGGRVAQLGIATLQTSTPSTTRPATTRERNAARSLCLTVLAGARRNACLAAAARPIVVPGTPITPVFTVGATLGLKYGAEVLALRLESSGTLLTAGYVIAGGDTDFHLSVATLAAQ